MHHGPPIGWRLPCLRWFSSPRPRSRSFGTVLGQHEVGCTVPFASRCWSRSSARWRPPTPGCFSSATRAATASKSRCPKPYGTHRGFVASGTCASCPDKRVGRARPWRCFAPIWRLLPPAERFLRTASRSLSCSSKIGIVTAVKSSNAFPECACAPTLRATAGCCS